MYPRTEYEMTERDMKELLEACKPTLCMMIGSYVDPGPQENANRAWRSLGEKMGFDYMTVRPIEGKGNRFFTAVPSETQTQRQERIRQQAEEAKQKEIAELRQGIREKTERLEFLEKEGQQ